MNRIKERNLFLGCVVVAIGGITAGANSSLIGYLSGLSLILAGMAIIYRSSDIAGLYKPPRYYIISMLTAGAIGSVWLLGIRLA